MSFRYAAPMTNDALEEMMQDKVTRAIAFSLYPQYSCSTTGSSLNELHKHIRLIDTEQKIKWSVVDRWFQNPGLISTFAEHINASLAEYPESQRDQVVLMFSAHSLPMSVVNRGDPYPAEVAATVAQVMALLGFSNPYRLVWQSQVGPSEWLGPKTSEAIVGFSKKVENVLLIPIAFVSDHVETLFELDIEYKELCEKNGLGYKRVESLNDDPMFIKAMEQVVLDHMQSPNGRQLMLQCPGCHKESCKATKAFFSQ